MDDFINKVGFGLNVVFSDGVGYPRTRWLLSRRLQRRAEVQGILTTPSGADAGLVQGASPGSRPSTSSGTAAFAQGLDASALTDDARRASGWRCYDAGRGAGAGGLRRHSGHRPLRLRQDDAGRLSPCCASGTRRRRARGSARARVNDAVAVSPPPTTALQIAFSAPGLAALGVEPSIIDQFSHEFRGGMTDGNRTRRSGDVGDNAPANWVWGCDGGATTPVPHVVFLAFAQPDAESGGGLEAFVQRLRNADWAKAFRAAAPSRHERHRRRRSPSGSPTASANRRSTGSSGATRAARTSTTATSSRSASSCSATATSTASTPIARSLDASANGASGALLPAEDSPSKKDVGRNGTYLVMRQLEQDVRGFWQFVQTRADDANDPAMVDRLSSAFVGRARDGTPLVPLDAAAIEGVATDETTVRQNQFTFERTGAARSARSGRTCAA